MDNAKSGIKESIEILEGIKAIGIPVKKAIADHKINGEDIPHAMELVKNHQIILDAIEGAGDSIKEAKDYDMAELAFIGSKAIEVIKAIKEA